MKPTILKGIFVLVFLFSCTIAYAELSVSSAPLYASISQSDCIVEVKLLSYTANGNVSPRNIQPEGTYEFKVISVLKGVANSTVHIALPQLLLYHYNFSAFPIKSGDKFLLLLRKINGRFSPVDTTLPLIPLANNTFAKPDAQNVQQEVIRLMLASLTDANIRGVDTYLLRDVVDPQITVALVAYLNDPDLRTRDAVLYCLATNQQVAVIPRIAELATTLNRQGQGAESTQTLENFTTSEAIPYLKPLIVTPDYLVRQEAVRSLYNIADTSCIPYLMLALRDPDGTVVYSAYKTLHRLVGDLGPAVDAEQFASHQEAELQRIYSWWNIYLSPKPFQRPDTTGFISVPDKK